MKPVRLDLVAPRSRVKHSTTEPLRSLFRDGDFAFLLKCMKIYCLVIKLHMEVNNRQLAANI